MINNLIFIVVLIFYNIFLFKLFIKIFNKLQIYDKPDFFRKIHKSNVALAGGAIFIINIFLYFFFLLFFEETNYFNGNREALSFILGSILIFLTGLYDDRYSLKPNTKLILIGIIVAMSVSTNDIFLVKDIKFIFYENLIYLEGFKFFFTIFCFLVFLNAFNMMDGVNGLSVSYFIICLIYLNLLNKDFYFFSFLLLPALVFLYYNFQNKVFLGDSGSLLLGFILSCLFIKGHNEQYIYADQIILLMMIPGIDMIRVATIRLINQKHPFKADQSHLHHIILKKYNPKISYYLIITIIGLTAFLSHIISNKFINILEIIFILIIYIFFLIFIKSK